MDSLKKHDNRQYWNNVYEGITEVKPVYDLWLDKFKDILKENWQEESILLQEREFNQLGKVEREYSWLVGLNTIF